MPEAFGRWRDHGQAPIPAAPQHPPNQHLLLQGLVPQECYKLTCLTGTANLSAFPLLIRAWLQACQAEEVIFK